MNTEIRIDVTKGKYRLIIDGPLELLHELIAATVIGATDNPPPVTLPNPDNPLTTHARPQKAG